MSLYQNIQVSVDDGVLTITLNREHKRNAFDEQTMDELQSLLKDPKNREGVTLAVLKANGKDFCAGADLEWMRSSQNLQLEELTQQNLKLQQCFQLWFDMPVFTIAIVQGNVIGGGLGLMAAADLVIANPGARFRFSEVNLGLIPATIAPFVLQRSKSRFIRNAMLTAETFDSDTALTHGLVDRVIDKSLVQDIILEYKSTMKTIEPFALSQCKKLVNDINHHRIEGPVDIYTAQLLAQMRKSDAALARIESFFKIIE